MGKAKIYLFERALEAASSANCRALVDRGVIEHPKGFFWLISCERRKRIRRQWRHLIMPSPYPLSISISFPDSSFARVISKVARHENMKIENVSIRSCLSRVCHVFPNAHPGGSQFVKLAILKFEHDWTHRRPNPYVRVLLSLFNWPSSFKKRSGRNLDPSGYFISSCVIALPHSRVSKLMAFDSFYSLAHQIFVNTAAPVGSRCAT